MRPTATRSAKAQHRFVTYLDPDLLCEVAPELVADWPAEDGCQPVPALLEATADASARDRLRIEARGFLADVRLVLRRELLPEGDLLPFVYRDPGGRLQLAARRDAVKVRVDAALNLAVIRQRPLSIRADQARVQQLRRELLDTLALPLGSGGRKPAPLLVSKDLAALRPHAVYIELGPPPGTGYANGRFERLRAFSDGKVLLVSLAPTRLASTYVPRGTSGTAPLSELEILDEPPEEAAPRRRAR